MSTLIRCPRCKSETDASAARPGSIIKCVHCRGDMRVPDLAKAPASGQKAGGRQSVLFRRMTNASVPGQRGRSVAIPGGSGGDRGASGRGRDLSGLYLGGGILALIGVIIAIGVVMKSNKGPEPGVKGGPRKEIARAPIQAPPPPTEPAPPPEPKKPPERVADSWEPNATEFVLASVKPILTESAAEKDGLNFIRTLNTSRILQSPFRYLPFVINSMVSEDRDLARATFQIVHAFCEERKILFADGSNPINIGKVNNAEYRAYMYQWMTQWWSEKASKLPDAPSNAKVVDQMDWVATVRQLIGGAYHDEDTPQRATFRKVKNLGRAAWPKLADVIDHDELSLGQAAAQVLTELTGEKKPRPNEQNKAEVKNAWIAWIEKNK